MCVASCVGIEDHHNVALTASWTAGIDLPNNKICKCD